MKIRVLAVGKTREAFVRLGIEHYETRIARLVSFSYAEVREEKHASGEERRTALAREGARLLRQVPERARLVLLDVRGEAKSSEGLAAWLADTVRKGASEVVFALGGPWGADESVRRRGNLLLSLSPMTFPHELVRVIVLEQIYRALSILRNSPYHHGG